MSKILFKKELYNFEKECEDEFGKNILFISNFINTFH